MFNITQGKGFHITFANGYTASVQWGKGNYCTNRYGEDGESSATAECAAWSPSGDWVKGTDGMVFPEQNPADVLAFLNRVAAL
jgi:hypothetical protein